jgi:predicted phage replisome organizer
MPWQGEKIQGLSAKGLMMAITFTKLDVNIFQNQKIRRIRRMSAGNDYFAVWIGLLCMAMKSCHHGLIIISENILADEDDIADFCDCKVSTVKEALAVFKRLGMVEKDGEQIFIPSFEEHQNTEKMMAQKRLAYERVKKSREKQKLLLIDTRIIPASYADDTEMKRSNISTDLRLKTKDKEEDKEKKEPVRTGEANASFSSASKISEGNERTLPTAAGGELFKAVYELRKKKGDLPIVKASGDFRNFYGKAAKKAMDEIEADDGLDFATKVFKWGMKDEFWKGVMLTAYNYAKVKAKYKSEAKEEKPSFTPRRYTDAELMEGVK